jgi:hypothetical protein
MREGFCASNKRIAFAFVFSSEDMLDAFLRVALHSLNVRICKKNSKRQQTGLTDVADFLINYGLDTQRSSRLQLGVPPFNKGPPRSI